MIPNWCNLIKNKNFRESPTLDPMMTRCLQKARNEIHHDIRLPVPTALSLIAKRV